MKTLLLALAICSFAIFTASSAFALSISVVDPNSYSLTIIEDFEVANGAPAATAWLDTLSTNVGTFTAGGSAGTGSTSYNANNNPDSSLPYFAIQSDLADNNYYGRYNTTVGGSQWLDSADITELSLDVSDYISTDYNALYFYIMDPSDCRATTYVNGTAATTESYTFNGQTNGNLFLMEIAWGDNETLSQIDWNVSSTGDGYGLDDFAVASAPVPEPSTLFLLGSGLMGLIGYRRKIKK